MVPPPGYTLVSVEVRTKIIIRNPHDGVPVCTKEMHKKYVVPNKVVAKTDNMIQETNDLMAKTDSFLREANGMVAKTESNVENCLVARTDNILRETESTLAAAIDDSVKTGCCGLSNRKVKRQDRNNNAITRNPTKQRIFGFFRRIGKLFI